MFAVLCKTVTILFTYYYVLAQCSDDNYTFVGYTATKRKLVDECNEQTVILNTRLPTSGLWLKLM